MIASRQLTTETAVQLLRLEPGCAASQQHADLSFAQQYGTPRIAGAQSGKDAEHDPERAAGTFSRWASAPFVFPTLNHSKLGGGERTDFPHGDAAAGQA